QSEPAMAAARALRQFMKEDNITSYDPRWEKGLMRHMIVRTAAGTGEVMVVLVINGKGIPNANKLVDMLDDAIFNVPVYEEGPLAGVEFNLESVVVNINKKNTSEILGEECITIAGKPTIMEEVGGLQFEISPLSFYQVNREQMVKLYNKAIEYADLKGGETVLDLYCGVGTIGLFCAADMNAKNPDNPGRVLGIESVKGAVIDANRNAVVNGIVNARYVCGKAEEELPKLVKGEDLKDESLKITQADVVILDPPRAGCEEVLLETVVQVAPEKIVYVSCDAATLARDIKFLSHRGYEFVKACPCDMFPHTAHCECVALLKRAEL
ncbi:MAG: 23S rRNA (uracil(1939)-C(5))-methyltransferase RlmD, partial [Firmicutes bacterium]|nr:23S rRNA (uracil(1939)-C(5))-methyltransferase RlmD [Bacillota bacterium]